MKELIYHRQLLPSVERNAGRVCTTNAATGATRTFAEHMDRVSRLIGGLRSLGVGRGDRFAVMTLNSAEYLELYHAAFLGGGVVNPLNLRFAPKELAYVLRDSGTKVCFVDFIFAPLIDKVKEEAGLEHVVLVGGGDGPHTASYEDLIASSAPVIPDEGEESDPVVLMYTGGTTGLPKGVLLDQRAEMLNAYHVMMRLSFGRDTVTLMQTPMFHAASMFSVLGGPAVGANTVIVPMFEPAAVMKAVREYLPTVTVMVPTMIGMTMAHPEFSPDGLGSFKYGVTVEVDPVPEVLPKGTSLARLPEGDYAVVRDFGTLDDVLDRFDWMLADWLPGSPYTQRRGAIFERYPDDPRNGPDGMVFEIWVPVNDRPN